MLAHTAEQLTHLVEKMSVFKEVILEAGQGSASIFGLCPPADPTTKEKFATWRLLKTK